MKRIELSRSFEKSYKKRISTNSKLDARYEERLKLFMSGERGHPLNDHSLSGGLTGKRAFSITSDVRVIYKEDDDYITFLDIGTHSQVY